MLLWSLFLPPLLRFHPFHCCLHPPDAPLLILFTSLHMSFHISSFSGHDFVINGCRSSTSQHKKCCCSRAVLPLRTTPAPALWLPVEKSQLKLLESRQSGPQQGKCRASDRPTCEKKCQAIKPQQSSNVNALPGLTLLFIKLAPQGLAPT